MLHDTPSVADQIMQLSASSAALDLALSQSPGPESQSNGWPSTRHRPAQHSLPAFALQSTAPQVNESPGGIVHQTRVPSDDSPRRILRFERHSTESKLISYPESMEATPHGLASLGNGSQPTSPPKLQSSYSTNDIPTTKPTENVMGVGTGAAASTQQRFHNHNASLGRIPPGAANRAPIRDNVGVENAFANREGFGMISQPLRSALQANAPLFGPPISSTGSTVHTPSGANTPTITQYPNPGFYGNYGMPMMGMNLNNMHMGSQLYQPHTPFASYPMYGYYGRGADSKGGRAMQQRRLADGEGLSYVLCDILLCDSDLKQRIGLPMSNLRAYAARYTHSVRISTAAATFRRSWTSAHPTTSK